MKIKLNNFLFWKIIKEYFLNDLDIDNDFIDLSKYDIKIVNDTLKLNYETSVNYFINIQLLLNNIEKENLTFSHLEFNDFLIVNNILLIINDKKLHSFNNKNEFLIKKYFEIKNNRFLPPEFKYEIPLLLKKSYCYYSIYFLFCELIDKNIEDITHTPLYYAVKRCSELNPEKRFLIII